MFSYKTYFTGVTQAREKKTIFQINHNLECRHENPNTPNTLLNINSLQT
jgi:hypothetical protein